MPSLELIDWPALGANALWVLGLALLLTRAGWLAATPRGAARSRLPFAWLTPAGGLLFCLGLGFTADGMLEKMLWFVLAGLGLAAAVLNRRQLQRKLSRP